MEHLENDMDDLFQKAGELYPLRTTGSDWDAVAGKLQTEAPGEIHDLSAPVAARTRNKRRWLLLLLLIPLGLGINYYSGQKNPEPLNPSSAKSTVTPADQNKNNSAISDGSASAKAADNSKSTSPDKIQIPAEAKVDAGTNRRKTTQPVNNGKVIITAGRNSLTSVNIQQSQKQKSVAANNPVQKSKGSAADKTESNLNSSDATGNTPKESGTVVAGSASDNLTSSAESASKTPAAVVPATVAAQSVAAASENKTDKAEAAKKVSQDSTTAKKKSNTTSKQSKGLYVGLIAGPDISSVDFQAVKHPGYSLGATLGYRFNKRLAIESGFIYDKKYYYSDGSHYKNQPSMYTIVDVDGNCDMFEIPLTVRYDFSFKKNGSFFAKGGFSSYLMRKQTYSGVSYNNYSGSESPWGPKSNYPQENYFFSIVQLSGGYEFSISDKTKIQIEPYVKIPLQGIGSGSMPISSAGIYFGITHSFR